MIKSLFLYALLIGALLPISWARTEEPTPAQETKPSPKDKGIPAELRAKAEKKLTSLGIKSAEYDAKLDEVIDCKSDADRKLAKMLILAGADVKDKGGEYLQRSEKHADVTKLLRIAGAKAQQPGNKVSDEAVKAAKLAMENAADKSQKLKTEIKTLLDETDSLRERDAEQSRVRLAQIEQRIPKLAEEEKMASSEYTEAYAAYLQCAEAYIATPATTLDEARFKAECATLFFMEVGAKLNLTLQSEYGGQRIPVKVWRSDPRLDDLERKKKMVKKRVNEYEVLAKKEGVAPQPLPFWPQRDMTDERANYELTTKVYKNVPPDFFAGEDYSTPEAVRKFLLQCGLSLGGEEAEGSEVRYSRKQKTITLTSTKHVHGDMKDLIEKYRRTKK